MAATRSRDRQLAIAGSVLAVMTVSALVALPGDGPAPAPAGAERSAPVLVSKVPATQREVAALVTACGAATWTDRTRLRELAHHEDPLLAGNAIAALGRLQAVHGDPELVAMLHDSRPRVRGEVVLALGASEDPAMAVHVRPLLADPDEQTAMLAVHAMVRLGATAPVAALSTDPAASPRLRQFAGAVLGGYRKGPLLAATGGIDR